MTLTITIDDEMVRQAIKIRRMNAEYDEQIVRWGPDASDPEDIFEIEQDFGSRMATMITELVTQKGSK